MDEKKKQQSDRMKGARVFVDLGMDIVLALIQWQVPCRTSAVDVLRFYV